LEAVIYSLTEIEIETKKR